MIGARLNGRLTLSAADFTQRVAGSTTAPLEGPSTDTSAQAEENQQD